MRTATAVLATALLFCAAASEPTAAADAQVLDQRTDARQHRAETLMFWQLDLDLDDGLTHDSDWGAVDLEFLGEMDILYFNLVVDGSWQVENMPVLSLEGTGVSQTRTYHFSLGVSSGTPVSEVTYAYDLTSSPLGTPPAGSDVAIAGDRLVTLRSGEIDESITATPAGPLIGGLAESWVRHPASPPFPNQDCGCWECVPAAISNSLMWLNAFHGLGIPANEIDIARMKLATGWTSNGAPTKPVAWWDIKDGYMQNPAFLPISTTTTINVQLVMQDMAAGCDVELRVKGHVVAVVAIGSLGGGYYWFDFVEDTQQGTPGGTLTGAAILDPGTGLLSGAPGVNGLAPDPFVVECYEESAGACCFDDGSCAVVMESQCNILSGMWMGDEYDSCEPNPCPTTSVAPITWATIKAIYR